MQSRTEQKRAEFNLDSWIPLANLLRSVVVGLFFLCIFVSLPPQFKVCVCVSVTTYVFVLFFFFFELNFPQMPATRSTRNITFRSFVCNRKLCMYVCVWVE